MVAVVAAITAPSTSAAVGVRCRQTLLLLLLRVPFAPAGIVEEVHVEHGHFSPRRVLERVHVVRALHREQHPRLVISVSLSQVSSLTDSHLALSSVLHFP